MKLPYALFLACSLSSSSAASQACQSSEAGLLELRFCLNLSRDDFGNDVVIEQTREFINHYPEDIQLKLEPTLSYVNDANETTVAEYANPKQKVVIAAGKSFKQTVLVSKRARPYDPFSTYSLNAWKDVELKFLKSGKSVILESYKWTNGPFYFPDLKLAPTPSWSKDREVRNTVPTDRKCARSQLFQPSTNLSVTYCLTAANELLLISKNVGQDPLEVNCPSNESHLTVLLGDTDYKKIRGQHPDALQSKVLVPGAALETRFDINQIVAKFPGSYSRIDVLPRCYFKRWGSNSRKSYGLARFFPIDLTVPLQPNRGD
jgi:hypothetical protein